MLLLYSLFRKCQGFVAIVYDLFTFFLPLRRAKILTAVLEVQQKQRRDRAADEAKDLLSIDADSEQGKIGFLDIIQQKASDNREKYAD